MEPKQIKELMALMGKTRTKRLRIKQDNFELELEQEDSFKKANERGLSEPSHVPVFPGEFMRETAKSKTQDIPASLHPLAPMEPPKEEFSGHFITSPMVGTYYASPGPDEACFVKVGDLVEKDTVVCIVEAMKVMNEVKAGVKGTIREILVESSHPVEFGTKLFKVS